MIGMQYSFMQDDYIATHLSSMINEYQLVSNVKAVRTTPDSKVKIYVESDLEKNASLDFNIPYPNPRFWVLEVS